MPFFANKNSVEDTSAKRRAIAAVTIMLAMVGVSCGRTKPASTGFDSGAPEAAAPTLLESVAEIVIPNCAVAGCHDSVSETHSMDLSTAAKIYENWVDRDGFDHCTNALTKRVIPGDVDGSLVVIKITGIAVCVQSQRMPLPPKPMLTAEQIDIIRDWIAAGAPSDGPNSDGGIASDVVARDGVPAADVFGDSAIDTVPMDAADPALCSSAVPCQPGLICSGFSCGEPWQCVAHLDETLEDDTLEHTCTLQTTPVCGCDGTTFQMDITCPDRPFDHVGACDDGNNCDPRDVACGAPMPVCEEGKVPSVVKGCYGDCVPVTSCRCQEILECPYRWKYGCRLSDLRCASYPLEASGPNAAQGGM